MILDATLLEECDKIISLVKEKKWPGAQLRYRELWHYPKMRAHMRDSRFSTFIGILDLATRGPSEWDYLIELQKLRCEVTIEAMT